MRKMDMFINETLARPDVAGFKKNLSKDLAEALSKYEAEPVFKFDEDIKADTSDGNAISAHQPFSSMTLSKEEGVVKLTQITDPKTVLLVRSVINERNELTSPYAKIWSEPGKWYMFNRNGLAGLCWPGLGTNIFKVASGLVVGSEQPGTAGTIRQDGIRLMDDKIHFDFEMEDSQGNYQSARLQGVLAYSTDVIMIKDFSADVVTDDYLFTVLSSFEHAKQYESPPIDQIVSAGKQYMRKNPAYKSPHKRWSSKRV